MNDEPNLPALPATPLEMIAHALTSGASADTLERLLGLQERYESSLARKAYAKAIADARGEIGPIFKSTSVTMGHGKPAYRHETLDDIERAVVPVFSKYGLSYRWHTKVPDNKPDWVIVTCHVEHRGGHFEENSLGGPADTSGAKNPLQAIGSSVTYLCRYTLKAALGLSATDDTDTREPVEPITEQQAAQLRERIMQVGQTEQRVCAFYKLDGLEDLPANLFDACMKKLALSNVPKQ